jgi:hypothetical protein
VELNSDEVEFLIRNQGVAHGVVEDTEQTYVHVTTLGEIRQQQLVDWSMLGMIMQVLVK